MMELNIVSSEILTKKTEEELGKILNVVCNQKTMLFWRILEILKRKGVNNEQIVRKYFRGGEIECTSDYYL